MGKKRQKRSRSKIEKTKRTAAMRRSKPQKQKHKIKSDIRSICRGYCYILRCKAFANIMRISL